MYYHFTTYFFGRHTMNFNYEFNETETNKFIELRNARKINSSNNWGQSKIKLSV